MCGSSLGFALRVVSVFTTRMLRQQHFDPAIRAAVGLAKSTLNKYYECTDFSKLYWISMGKWYFVVLLCYATDC